MLGAGGRRLFSSGVAGKQTLEQLAGSLQPGTSVLVRLDLNVPFSKSDPTKISDDARLRAVLPTLELLRAHNLKTVVATHCGRPKGAPDPALSVHRVAPRLAELTGAKVRTAADCVGAEARAAASALGAGEVLLLENVRFHPGETKNDPQFAAQLAADSMATVYVNDAFGTAHRAHGSTVGVTEHMAHSVAGLLMAKELQYLMAAIEQPVRPMVAIIGGAKVSTKLPVIQSLLRKCDAVVLGGGMIGTFLQASGRSPGATLVEPDLVPMAAELMESAQAMGKQLIIPTDVVIADQFTAEASSRVVSADAVPDGWMALDLGPSSLEAIDRLLSTASTVVWNGPLGVFEFEQFAVGTRHVAKVLAAQTAERAATTIIGGGDSVAAINQGGFADQVSGEGACLSPGQVSHLSTGGGAALEMLEGKVLPGVAALDNQL